MSTERQMNSTPKNTTNVDMSLAVLKQSRLFSPEFTPVCTGTHFRESTYRELFSSGLMGATP